MRLAAAIVMLSALPANAAQDQCRADYQRGFTDGVAAVNEQLGAVTAQMQRDVQAQVNAQLAQLDASRTRELDQRLAAAQTTALQTAPAPRAGGAAAQARAPMPHLPPLVRAPGGGIAPAPPVPPGTGPQIAHRPDPRIPAQPAALPPGTTITISDPQNLPPDLFRALMEYAAR